MKKSLLLLLVLAPLFALSQNNFIFGGGPDDGQATARTETSTNNGIFGGGIDDGHATARTEIPTSNGIFGGGIDDGHATIRTETPTNNGIFGGGPDDGHTSIRVETPTNNGIFGGGPDDGHAHILFEGIPLRFPRQLEVGWLDFAAVPVQDQVRLNWATSREVNHEVFVVERSQDLQSVVPLGEEIPGSGSPDERAQYEAWDTQPLLGTNYYRIKAIDPDGAVSYTQWEAVWFEHQAYLDMLAFPNPAAHQLTLRLQSRAQQSGQLRLLNVQGQTLWSQDISLAVGQSEWYIDVRAFAEGVYILEIHTSLGTYRSLRIAKHD